MCSRARTDVFVVNEGANTLDIGRNVLDMYEPRKRLDSGTWGVMGVGLGYAIAAAVESGGRVVAVEGDSAFGFSGMEIETICRYQLPIVVVVFNNGGVYRGDDINHCVDRSGADRAHAAPAATTGSSRRSAAPGYHAEDPAAADHRIAAGARSTDAAADQLRHRPDGRHRERPPAAP